MLTASAGLSKKASVAERDRIRPGDQAEVMQEGRPEPFDEPDKAAQYYVMKRTTEPSGIPVEKYLAAFEHVKRMPQYSTRLGRSFPSQNDIGAAQSRELSLGSWTQLGPGNVGGRTRAFVINPINPNIMYAAAVAGGIWKTTDAGTSWSPLTDLLPNIAVSCMAINAQDPSILYAGTGEGYYNIDAVRGPGLLKTTDGGSTWSVLDINNDYRIFYVNRIVISPHDGNRIYAGTNNGIIRSTDGGASWAQVFASGVECMDLAIRTDVPADYVIGSFGNFNHNQIVFNTDAAGPGSWSFSATAFGETWGVGRTSIALAPSNQNIVYALASEYFNAFVDPQPPGPYQYGLHAVYRSTDGGLTWTARVRNTDPNKLNTVLLSNPFVAFLSECGQGTSQLINQGWYDNVIAVDPVDPNRVWAGGIDLFRSDDGGANWGLASYWWANQSASQYAHADQHAIVFHPQYNGGSNQTMFVTGDGGIFKTTNARGAVATGSNAACNSSLSAVTWTALNNNYAVTQFYNGVPYPNGATYFGGTQDNGTLRGATAGGPGSWTRLLGGDGGYVAVDPTNTNILFAENTGLSIQRSTNGGVSFAPATSGITESPNNFLFIAPFAMNPTIPSQMLTGGSYVWKSQNGGVSWSRATDNTVGTGVAYSAFAFAPTNSNRQAAGLSSGWILFNDDSLPPGFHWVGRIPRGNAFVSSVAFDPTNDNTIYATFSTFNQVASNSHVYRYTDFGTSLTAIDGYGDTALPDIPVHSIVIDKSNNARLYVGTDLGVFVSLDAGNSWARENSGFANVPTESLSLNTVGGVTTLFAFTHGRGAWRVDLPAACASVNPLAQAFPSGGGNGSVTVTASAGCGWTATSNDSWITIIGGSSGSGNGSVSYQVGANTGSGTVSPRTGSITVAGQTVTISQDGVFSSGTCNFLVSPTVQHMPAAGGHGVVTFFIDGNCSISRDTVIEYWISIASGSGPQMLYSVEQNTSTNPRTAVIRFRDQTTSNVVATVTIVQDGAGCATAISSRSQAFSGAGGTSSVNVSAPGSCRWTSVSNDSFITITSGNSGSGNGGVTYSVAANVGPARTGTLTISGQVFTVNQDFGCAFTLDQLHQSFAANGGAGTITITAPNAGCAWAATTTSFFITITSGKEGTGNGTVHFDVAPNLGQSIRSGTITVAGQAFTVYEGINFPDVPSNDSFYTDIGKLSARGVTLGCGNGNFCPADPVTREQMAAFIVRAKGEFNPPTPPSQRFNDVPPSNLFYNFIDRLADLQITLGCTPDHLMYCPADPVKRDQMAAFLLRGLGEFNPPTPPSQRFSDVPPSNVFYNFIDRLAVLQITLGCTPDHLMYCPNDSVTRAQMAAFLVRAFNL